MSVKIRLSLKFLGTGDVVDDSRARVGILAFRIVGLHMRFPIVASLEQLAADLTFMSSFLRRSPLPLLL